MVLKVNKKIEKNVLMKFSEVKNIYLYILCNPVK